MLSKAYMATLGDPKFLAEMTSRQYTIDPISGARIQKFVETVMNTPPAKVAKLRRLMGLTKK